MDPCFLTMALAARRIGKTRLFDQSQRVQKTRRFPEPKAGQLHAGLGGNTTAHLIVYRDNYLAKLLAPIEPLIGKVGLF